MLSTDSAFNVEHLEREVEFTAASNWNGTGCILSVNEAGGFFQFTPENDTDILISYENLRNVKVNNTGIASGTTVTFGGSSVQTVTWGFIIGSWLPVMFIFGMIGLGSMFYGVLVAVQTIQKKQYRAGFITGLTAFSVGVCLVLSWLWG